MKQTMTSEVKMRPGMLTAMVTCLWLVLSLAGACRAAGGQPVEIKKGEHYRVLAGNQVEAAGGRVTLRVKITDGWKLNEKAPFIIKASGSGGITPATTKLRKHDARKVTKQAIDFLLPYRGTPQAGAGLKLTFDFVICTDTLCQKKRFSVDYPLTTKR